MHRKTIFLILIAVLILAAGTFLARDSLQTALFNVTGEESLLGQVRGLIDLRLELHAPDAQHRRQRAGR